MISSFNCSIDGDGSLSALVVLLILIEAILTFGRRSGEYSLDTLVASPIHGEYSLENSFRVVCEYILF